jgi:hypothetical protein
LRRGGRVSTCRKRRRSRATCRSLTTAVRSKSPPLARPASLASKTTSPDFYRRALGMPTIGSCQLREKSSHQVVGRQFDTQLDHVLAKDGHPSRAIGLLEIAAGGQRRAAVEHSDVVQTEKAPPSKTFFPRRSFRFTHQLKFDTSLRNDRFKKSMSGGDPCCISMRLKNKIAKA